MYSLDGFNVGTDFTATLQDQFGDIFNLEDIGLLMEFDCESMDRELEVVPISDGGVPLFLTIPAGWRGRMMFTRDDGNFQSMVAEIFNAYHSQGIIPIFTMQTSVLNRNGSIDDYTYSGIQFNKPRTGNYRAEKEVDMQMEFRASLMTVAGANAPFLIGLAGASGNLF